MMFSGKDIESKGKYALTITQRVYLIISVGIHWFVSTLSHKMYLLIFFYIYNSVLSV